MYAIASAAPSVEEACLQDEAFKERQRRSQGQLQKVAPASLRSRSFCCQFGVTFDSATWSFQSR